MVSVLEKSIIRQRALPISVEGYHVMAERGLVEKRAELIRGVIVEKMPKSPLHELLVDRLYKAIERAVGDVLWVRKEGPLTLQDSEPEPDVSVVTGDDSHYVRSHPRTAKLAVEVAISSEELDREKGAIYAEAGVEEYWLVFAEESVVEVHGDWRDGGWRQVRRFARGETITSLVLPKVSVAVGSIFPS